MSSRSTVLAPAVFALLIGCSPAAEDPAPGRSGGSAGNRGGTGGSPRGSGGSDSGSGGAQGGSPGSSSGGSVGSGGSAATGGGGGSAKGGSTGSGGAGSDASAPSDGSGAPLPPSAPGQGPTAMGKIVFSNDFEQGMTGVTRSPNGIPEDRIQIVDDPVNQRGKVIRIEYKQGDNFRTSAGTEPRSWISAADGYTIRSNTKVSVAWGTMFENVNGATYSFAQIIRSGGPLWMFHINGGGSFRISVNRGSGGGSNLLTFQPKTWYDFRVDVDYRGGGSIAFYANGKMVARGTGDGGASDGRWDGGVYWQSGAKSTRVVYVSNVSIAEW